MITPIHPPTPDPPSRLGISIIHQNVGSPFRDNTPNLPEVIRTQKAQQMPTNVPQKGKKMKNAAKLYKRESGRYSGPMKRRLIIGFLLENWPNWPNLETDPIQPMQRRSLKSRPPESLSSFQFKLPSVPPLQPLSSTSSSLMAKSARSFLVQLIEKGTLFEVFKNQFRNSQKF